MLSWTELDQVHPKSNRILVVGGGLTAVQVALKLCKLGKTCILCSRRHLVERHFDIGLEWFELRTANKCMSDFYYQNVSDRLTALKAVRGGGSVPPLYMREVERAERSGRLIRVIGEATYEGLHERFLGGHKIEVCLPACRQAGLPLPPAAGWQLACKSLFVPAALWQLHFWSRSCMAHSWCHSGVVLTQPSLLSRVSHSGRLRACWGGGRARIVDPKSK